MHREMVTFKCQGHGVPPRLCCNKTDEIMRGRHGNGLDTMSKSTCQEVKSMDKGATELDVHLNSAVCNKVDLDAMIDIGVVNLPQPNKSLLMLLWYMFIS